VFTNVDRGGFVTHEVTHWVLKHYLELEVPEPEPIEASEDALSDYVGHYGNPFSDTEFGMLNGKLVAQVVYKRGFPAQDSPIPPSPPPMSLTLCEEDRLLILNGPLKDGMVDVLRKPDGSIGWIRAGGRISERQA